MMIPAVPRIEKGAKGREREHRDASKAEGKNSDNCNSEQDLDA